jgi:hypothetical protein
MFLFETILFYNGVPSYYKVQLQGNQYFFEAVALEYYKDIEFPHFFLTEADKDWKAEGTDNQQLIEQAIEDLQKFSYLRVPEVA